MMAGVKQEESLTTEECDQALELAEIQIKTEVDEEFGLEMELVCPHLTATEMSQTTELPPVCISDCVSLIKTEEEEELGLTGSESRLAASQLSTNLDISSELDLSITNSILLKEEPVSEEEEQPSSQVSLRSTQQLKITSFVSWTVPYKREVCCSPDDQGSASWSPQIRPCHVLLDRKEVMKYFCRKTGQYRFSSHLVRQPLVSTLTRKQTHNALEGEIIRPILPPSTKNWRQPVKTRYAMKGSYVCPTCDKPFLKPVLLRRHLVTHSSERTFQCEICGLRCKHERYLAYHNLKKHSTSKKHECKLCYGKIFSDASRLQRHFKVVHKSNKKLYVSCGKCKKMFKSKQGLKLHMVKEHLTKRKSKHLSKKYECSTCKKSYGLKSILKTHILDVHMRKRTQECADCSKMFFTKKYLIRHIISVHNKSRPHKCKICDIRFAEKHQLRNHLLCERHLQKVKGGKK